MKDPARVKLPMFARVFAWVVALFIGYSLLITLIILVVLTGLWTRSGFETNHLTSSDILSLLGFFSILIVQTAYSAVFFSSSIGILRRKKKALKPFRRCLWLFNGYMVLAAIGQFVVYLVVRPPESELLLVVIPVFSGVTIIVAWLSARMFRILSAQMVTEIME